MDLGRVSLQCFLASYAVGMVGEFARLFSSARWPRWLARAGAIAGLFAQTLFLGHISATDHRLPTINQYESLIFVSWVIGLIYLYLLLRDRRLAAGIFIQPITVGLLLFAGTFPGTKPAPREGLSILATAHGLLLLAGAIAVCFAAIFAAMYLVKVRQLKQGDVHGRLRLPSLERLDRWNTVAIYLAWPLLFVGIGLGFTLKRIDQITQLTVRDPKVFFTILAWCFCTALVHYRYHPENRGRRIAILTLVCCVLVLASMLVDPLGTVHQAGAGGLR